MKIVRLEGRVPWRSYIDPESQRWIATCAPLALTVEGETYSDLMESISETLDMALRDLFETGDLNKFLTERGWTPVTPIPGKSHDVRFDIPWKVIEQSAHGSQRSVH